MQGAYSLLFAFLFLFYPIVFIVCFCFLFFSFSFPVGVLLDLYRARIGSLVCRMHCTTAGRWFSTADDLAHFALQTAGSEQVLQTVLSIPLKLAGLLLLMIVLRAKCQACLLIIGAVEQNPGPSTPECVLAHLSAKAPSSEIRGCIRFYDQQRDYSTDKKQLSAVPVGILVETMTYLGVPGQDVYVKPTIVHNLSHPESLPRNMSNLFGIILCWEGQARTLALLSMWTSLPYTLCSWSHWNIRG